ncbi:hypothetical protein KIL84_009956 [Mauremys mutica]|uniref:Uncharacterized protein n=1 Tax=Mauremys mutica TaxID=74926 RepID=A0A9D4AZC9_9SAUR|nr:hypothetical protein KIL84_009956 [Mauremys mutica]
MRVPMVPSNGPPSPGVAPLAAVPEAVAEGPGFTSLQAKGKIIPLDAGLCANPAMPHSTDRNDSGFGEFWHEVSCGQWIVASSQCLVQWLGNDASAYTPDGVFTSTMLLTQAAVVLGHLCSAASQAPGTG